MPANLTPQYLQAEKEFRNAKGIEEKTACLENMLTLIPKHKGTDKLQADLKRRLSKLRRQGEKTSKTRRRAIFRVEREGAGQIALIGAPNAGKSALLAALTNADAATGAYPFTTRFPRPGMVQFEDIQIQLVDLPPLTKDYMESWMPDVVRRADGVLLVADLGTDNVLDDLEIILDRLDAVKVRLMREVPEDAVPQPGTFRRTAIVANKTDLDESEGRLEVLRDVFSERFDIWPVSAVAGTGLDEVASGTFQLLKIIRVYTKEPSRKPDMNQPYTIDRGSTVLGLATKVHREFEHTLKYARLWGSGKYEGIRVRRDHVLEDGDILELHE